jgi:hypothetical protein
MVANRRMDNYSISQKFQPWTLDPSQSGYIAKSIFTLSSPSIRGIQLLSTVMIRRVYIGSTVLNFLFKDYFDGPF